MSSLIDNINSTNREIKHAAGVVYDTKRLLESLARLHESHLKFQQCVKNLTDAQHFALLVASHALDSIDSELKGAQYMLDRFAEHIDAESRIGRLISRQ